MKLREQGPDRLVGRRDLGGHHPVWAVLGSLSTSALVYLIFENGGIVAAVFCVTLLALFHWAREGFTIDRWRRLVTTWWGFGVPLRSKERSLDGCNEVSLSSEEADDHGGGTVVVYPVRIQGTTDPIPISEPRKYEEARCLARRIACFLGLPMVETCGGNVVRIEANQLDLPLREQIAATDQDVTWAEPPSRMRCAYQIRGDSITIEIPRKRMTLRSAVGTGLVAMALLAFAPAFWFATKNAPKERIAAMGRVCATLGCASMSLVALASGIHACLKRTTVDASPKELRIRSRGLWTKTDVIPTGELLELVVKLPDGQKGNHHERSLIARSGDKSIEVDLSEHPRQELEWIRSAVLYVVTGGA
ncbi:MAG: hypothetical protein JXQ73_04060 [Phycisphaerae bacterium]|nr:hypothetical protein [Phycisphaerae bacterium]